MSADYDQEPFVPIRGHDEEAWAGYAAIGGELARAVERLGRPKTVIVVESYPGVRRAEIVAGFRQALSAFSLDVREAEDAALPPSGVQRRIERYLTDDRVFGYLSSFRIDEFYEADKLEDLRASIEASSAQIVLVTGFGASLAVRGDLRLYADLTRWEIQQRLRSGEIGGWRETQREDDPLKRYKRGFFFEWRMADRFKREHLRAADYYLDTNVRDAPVMVTGRALFAGLAQAAGRPFRLVPYFDPGVWGGQWLQRHIGLPGRDHPYAWGFDGVPEENSLYFRYGAVRLELPAINLVLFRSIELLGEPVYARFGAEFPIRFDFLDTIGGQNLSLQVHPDTAYIREQFGMAYTQDESYYILEAEPGAEVYLGLRENISADGMIADLRAAQAGEISFPAEDYVQTFPASAHDHFLIPAGTVHCSASGCMVLEISATPYIFTFKLWDWDRVGLDGRPRPVHLEHGEQVIRWDRTTAWTEAECVNRVEEIERGPGWTEERTGLHKLQFIETRRHWFSETVSHEQNGSVHMLNLVSGEEATVESVDGSFEPFVVRYAETFIVPAAVGGYTIRPSGPSAGRTIGTIKAYVRV
ncbi:class I mannose-6-phosphate isomerase [Saccharibacillus brassicae]|uniref:Mannose-6-phosphate isomerase n=1 Tax=Saccharibacillus brassicae TaxID=2583377 RepID=A0A4Y6V3D3_SACBS|nr:class I mannose-6-phosphate isomerase [Saccharibacillus brassicae]QDH23116.1 mannose-6-phosphate isomerase [Saccharibacillus brassicae]